MVLAEAWQGERRLWVDGVMVDVSLGRHEDKLTASAGWKDEKVLKRTEQGCKGFKAINMRQTFWCRPQCFQYIWRRWPQMSLWPDLSIGKNKRIKWKALFSTSHFIFILYHLGWNIRWGKKNMLSKNTSICSCLESTNGPSCRVKETPLNPTHKHWSPDGDRSIRKTWLYQNADIRAVLDDHVY